MLPHTPEQVISALQVERGWYVISMWTACPATLLAQGIGCSLFELYFQLSCGIANAALAKPHEAVKKANRVQRQFKTRASLPNTETTPL